MSSLLEDETYLNDLKNNLPQWKTMGTNDLSDKRSVWDWLTTTTTTTKTTTFIYTIQVE